MDFKKSLNPCCNGIYSMSAYEELKQEEEHPVLILVVMEYTQWEPINKKKYEWVES